MNENNIIIHAYNRNKKIITPECYRSLSNSEKIKEGIHFNAYTSEEWFLKYGAYYPHKEKEYNK